VASVVLVRGASGLLRHCGVYEGIGNGRSGVGARNVSLVVVSSSVAVWR